MVKGFDHFLGIMQKSATGVVKTVHNGTTVALEAVHQSSQIALNAVKKSAHVSVQAIENFTELKGHPLAVLNGILGDTLAQQNSKLAIKMNLLGKKSGKRLCIFVHGICSSETSWQYSKNPHKSYGSLLEKSHGYTPLYLRYNSGLHISSNGQLLTKIITDYCDDSLDTIEEIIFMGHSMGGLVIRSACHYAQKNQVSWAKKIRKIFMLGTPHHGNDYEKLGNISCSILKLIPNLITKKIAKLGNQRSAGIKDLRFGYLLDEDWLGHDPDSLLQDNWNPVPLLKEVDYYIISGTLAKNTDNIFTQYFGDGVVPTYNAAGKSLRKSKTIPFPSQHIKMIRGVSHNDLARHTKVYQQIRKWCLS